MRILQPVPQIAVPLIAVGLLAGAPARAQDLPPAIAAFAAEVSAQCADMGGTPRVGPAFATAVDLDSDGRLDRVVDLAGVECENAWSAFCGSAGCPVSVWIDGPSGLERRWSDYAQGWTLDAAAGGMALVVTRHGSACPGAPSGADSCEERLVFDGPSAAARPVAEAPAAAAAPAAAQPPTAPGWTLRAAPGGESVAVSRGAGSIETLALFCLAGEPFLAATWAGQAPETAEIEFGLSSGPVAARARREEGAGGALIAPLRGQPLAGRLAGRDSAADLSVDGAAQGRVSLQGSTRAIRAALAGCGGV